MTEVLFDNLKNWVCGVLGDVEVTPHFSKEVEKDDLIVTLYLISLEESSSTGVRPVKNRLKLTLNYLVRVSGDTHKSNNAITKLAFSAMSSEDMEPEFRSISQDIWKAFGIQPGPSFILKVPLQFELPEKEICLVKEPMILKNTPIT